MAHDHHANASDPPGSVLLARTFMYSLPRSMPITAPFTPPGTRAIISATATPSIRGAAGGLCRLEQVLDDGDAMLAPLPRLYSRQAGTAPPPVSYPTAPRTNLKTEGQSKALPGAYHVLHDVKLG